MKKRVLSFILTTCSLSSLFSLHTNKTTFIPHTPALDLVLQEPLIRYKRNRLQKEEPFDVSYSFFHQTSTNPKDIRRYFFIDGQDSLRVKDADVVGSREIAADWLNINSVNALGTSLFQSTLSITPRAQRYGVILNARYQFPQLESVWYEFAIPFLQAETNIHLQENDIQGEQSLPNGSAIDVSTNAKNALINPLWRYGKFKHTVNRKAGLGDINFKIGLTTLEKKDLINAFYLSLLVPTAPHPTNEYIFEPFLGNGGHVGLGAGTQFDWTLLNSDFNSLSFLTTVDYKYLLKSTQFRSFDLSSNGAWSRYLQVISSSRVDNVDYGINYFTKRMNVTPGSTVSILSSVHFAHSFSPSAKFHLEGGHSLWYREQENVSLVDPWTDPIGIASGTAGDTGDTTHSKTQPTATIGTNKQTLTAASFSFIPESNLNLLSATHPRCISNTFFLALGMEGRHKNHDYYFNAGLSFEKGHSNAILDQLSTWLSFTLTL